METFITILVFVGISVFSQWLKNRQGGSVDEDSDEPAPSAPPKKQTGSWEEELRRMLEQGAPPAPRPSTPPLVPTPPPLVQRPGARPPRPVPEPVAMEMDMEAEARKMARLEQSRRASERVARMEQQTNERMALIDPHHTHYYKGNCMRCGGKLEFPAASAGTSIICPHCQSKTLLIIAQTSAHLLGTQVVSRNVPSQDVVRVVSLLRSPSTAREVVIASVIMGPPKAFEV